MVRGIDGRARVITCQPHNRATIVRRNPMLSLQLPKKLPAFEFWQVLHPPSRARAAEMPWLVEVSKAPKHLCLELPARPKHLRVDTPSGGRKGRGSTKSSKTRALARFSQGICISNISNPRWDCPPYVLYVPMAYQAYIHVKNETPQLEMQHKMQPLHQKLRRYVLF